MLLLSFSQTFSTKVAEIWFRESFRPKGERERERDQVRRRQKEKDRWTEVKCCKVQNRKKMIKRPLLEKERKGEECNKQSKRAKGRN